MHTSALEEEKQLPHPEYPKELVRCYRVKTVNRSPRRGGPTFVLIDAEGFHYGTDPRASPTDRALTKACGGDASVWNLAAGASADIWVAIHMPPEAQPTTLEVYTSELVEEVEVFDAGAIRLREGLKP